MQPELFQLNAALELTHWWFVARRTIIVGLVHEILPPSPDRHVIDIGCGTGANIAALAEEYEVEGYDQSEQAISLARQRFPNVAFHCQSATEPIRALETQDVVLLLNDVIEHIEHDREFLTEIVEAAPPGSFVLMTVPADPALWGPHDVSHGHFRRYTLESFRSLWRDMPVEELLHSYYNARLYGPVRFVRSITGRTNRSYGASDSDLSVPPSWINGPLTRIFAGELPALREVLGSGRSAYRSGVSIVTILRKSGGI